MANTANTAKTCPPATLLAGVLVVLTLIVTHPSEEMGGVPRCTPLDAGLAGQHLYRFYRLGRCLSACLPRSYGGHADHSAQDFKVAGGDISLKPLIRLAQRE